MTRKIVISLLMFFLAVQTIQAQATAELSGEELKAISNINNVFRRAVEIAKPAVVTIHLFQSNNIYEESSGLGSGVIIDKAGYVLTNNHVAEGNERFSVVLDDGRIFSSVEKYLDPDTDLAIIKIEPAGDTLPFAKFGNSDEAQVGDFVLAIGSPFELSQTVTMGIISHKGRQTSVLGQWGLEDFIQTDADINKGNSGGPLVNLKGEVIGINSNIYSPTGVSAGYGFAVPSNIAKDVSAQLIANKEVKRGYLGVQLISKTISELRQSTDQELLALTQRNNQDMAYLKKMLANLPENTNGVLIAKVEDDTPAAKGGIKSYDIVTKYNGKEYAASSQLRQDIAMTLPESQANFEVLRNGKKVELTVTLGDRRVAKAEIDKKAEKLAQNQREFRPPYLTIPQIVPQPDYQYSRPKLGLTIENITPDLAEKYGYSRAIGTLKQVVITGVRLGSLAEQFGLSEGDVVQSVNGEQITDATQLKEIIENSDLSIGIKMRISNAQGSREISIIDNQL